MKTQVIAAEGDCRLRCAIVEARPHAHGQTAAPARRLNAADKERRTKRPAVKLEARRPIENTDTVAVFAGDDGLEHRAVAQVTLSGACVSDNVDLHEPGLRIIAIDECVEQRIAVEPRIAEPHMAGAAIDDAGNRAVTDDGEIHGHCGTLYSSKDPDHRLAVWLSITSRSPCPLFFRRMAAFPPGLPHNARAAIWLRAFMLRTSTLV